MGPFRSVWKQVAYWRAQRRSRQEAAAALDDVFPDLDRVDLAVVHPGSRTINMRFSAAHQSDARPVAVLYVYVICARACANCVASAGVIAAGNFSSPAVARLLIIAAMPEFAS